MPTDWWILADEWASWLADKGSGDARADRSQFARERRTSVATVARAEAARWFVERLAHQGRLRNTGDLRGAPITHVAALGRIERYSPVVVDRLLPEFASRRKLSGFELRRLEDMAKEQAMKAHRAALANETAAPAKASAIVDTGTSIRSVDEAAVAAAPPAAADVVASTPLDEITVTRPLDGFGLRALSRDLVDRLLATLSAPGCVLAGGRPGRVWPELLAAPLALDAVVIVPEPRGNESFRGFRAYPAVASNLDRKRLSSALLLGMFASRVVHQYFAVFERKKEATELAMMLDTFGAAGFGVAWLDPADRLIVAREAVRAVPPDLAEYLKERLRVPLPA